MPCLASELYRAYHQVTNGALSPWVVCGIANTSFKFSVAKILVTQILIH